MTSQFFQSKNLAWTTGYTLRDANGNVIYTNTGGLTDVPDSYVPNVAAGSFVASYNLRMSLYMTGFADPLYPLGSMRMRSQLCPFP
jgi:hypothetical protein